MHDSEYTTIIREQNEKIENLETALDIRKGTITIQQDIIDQQHKALEHLSKRIDALEKISRATTMELIDNTRALNDN